MNCLVCKGRRAIIKLWTNQTFEGELFMVTKSEIHLTNAVEYTERVEPANPCLVLNESTIKSVKILFQKLPPTEEADNGITVPGGECDRLIDVINGQRIIIELQNNQMFEGDLLKATQTRIDVTNITEYPERKKLKDTFLSFYAIEIMSVKLLLSKLPHAEELSSDIIAIETEEYNRLMDMADQHIYLPVRDQRYIAAIDDLNLNESIGVVALWSNYGRFRRTALLVLSTWYQVYIFDLQFYRLQTFPPELQAILESEYKEKVIHGSAKLLDCLTHAHKIKLNNVFDTQMADVKIQKTVTGQTPKEFRNLSECTAHYFNFPGSFLKRSLDVSAEEWEQRPLSSLLKHEAAQLATYLISLKDKQKAILLKEYVGAMEAYSQGVLNLSAADNNK